MTEIPRAQDQLFDRSQSAREKYVSLVVGQPGWGALIRHELVTLASQNVPGAVGLVLRRTLYPSLLGACGRNVVFGQNVVLRHPHKIRIGDDVVVDDNCLIDAKGDTNRGVTIGSRVFIGRNTILSCKNGDIDLDDGANIGFNCEIFSASTVRVGRDTLVAAYCYLIGGDHDFADPSQPVQVIGAVAAAATIGALGLEQPASLIRPQFLHPHAHQLRGDRDAVHAALPLRLGHTDHRRHPFLGFLLMPLAPSMPAVVEEIYRAHHRSHSGGFMVHQEHQETTMEVKHDADAHRSVP